MDKIQILTTCQACSGKAYLPTGEEISMAGYKYIRHKPCPACDGSGKLFTTGRVDLFTNNHKRCINGYFYFKVCAFDKRIHIYLHCANFMIPKYRISRASVIFSLIKL